MNGPLGAFALAFTLGMIAGGLLVTVGVWFWTRR